MLRFQTSYFNNRKNPNTFLGGFIMKRFIKAHVFVSMVLGAAVGDWTSRALSQSDIYYGVLAILAVIALVLYLFNRVKTDSNTEKD